MDTVSETSIQFILIQCIIILSGLMCQILYSYFNTRMSALSPIIFFFGVGGNSHSCLGKKRKYKEK